MALIELRQQNKVPDTIRFLRFPPTALLGRHQDLSHEINLDYCAENGIGTVRRITGGGAIYLDEGQLGWELVFHRKSLGITKLPCLAREICNAAAAGLGELGVNAKFRPRNDIEVDGRKISGTGGFFDGEVLIYQGTVLVDMNPAKMVKALNIPAAKVAKHNLDTAEQRVVTLKELLGDDLPDVETIKTALIKGFTDVLGITAEPGEITEAEEALAKEHFDEEIGTDEFVADIDNPGRGDKLLEGTHTGAGGTINAFVKLEGPTSGILQRALLTGDFFVTPPRTIFDLEATLIGTRLEDVERTIRKFFAKASIDTLSVAADDFIASINDECKSTDDAFVLAAHTADPMNVVAVIQHTAGEYLGLMEDHLEGRRIRFQYFRPFAAGKLPAAELPADALMLLGGGPWGTAGTRDLPTLAEEVELTRQRLAEGTPVVTRDDALNGFLPKTFNQVIYMRDWPVLPAHATVLATDNLDRPAVWQIGENAFGFSGNPGIKLGMVEDLIMEFEEVPVDSAGQLEKLRALQAALEDELVPIMTGLVQCTALMSSPKAAESARELDAQVI
jgi:lipoate-protein ligase A